jgi:hypothetical protein
MTSLILAALLAATSPSGDAAQPSGAAPGPAAPPPATAPKNDPNKMICRIEDTYGSRTKTRTCKTRAQWEADEDAAKRFIDERVNRQSATPPETAPVL